MRIEHDHTTIKRCPVFVFAVRFAWQTIRVGGGGVKVLLKTKLDQITGRDFQISQEFSLFLWFHSFSRQLKNVHSETAHAFILLAVL